ncbi:Monothiol glutaredoxin-5 [Hortaea werneckii]|nr:Monothiol glutaredoxin-5 [Hortaea werneckii]KAI7150259.1 Monothiol glutaredoxin-5 [Hortaea werneckii]KAI7176919.1 Monothiol glutaredoxin-5 [Hortaea werneckii]KAI7193887.1 Monothiol glutaredoxin-5 [Hortaea werneckii]
MFSRRVFSAVAGQALRPQSNPILSSRFAPLQKSFLSTETRSAIDKAVGSAPVVLFMKGTPETPQCGFSRASIQILGLQGVNPQKFTAFNVLEDEELRSGIKEYSDWPTVPQLYVEKEFVGGTDIMMSMHQDGSLAKLLEEKGVLVPAEEPTAAIFEPHHRNCSMKRGNHPAQAASKAGDIDLGRQGHKRGVKRQNSTVFIGSLFDGPRAIRRKVDEQQQYIEAEGKGEPSFQRHSTMRKQAERHPSYRRFLEATERYKEGVHNAGEQLIDPVFEELVGRINGLDVHGKPLGLHGTITETDMKEADRLADALSTPFEGEVIQVGIKQGNGTVERRQVNLSDNLKKSETNFEQRKKTYNERFETYHEVCHSIEALLAELSDANNADIQQAEAELNAELAEIDRCKRTHQEQSLRELSDVHAKNKAESDAMARKMQDFLIALQ